jgi:hypothetical protein
MMPLRIGQSVVTSGRSLAAYGFEVLNQRGERIQSGRMKVVVRGDDLAEADQ